MRATPHAIFTQVQIELYRISRAARNHGVPKSTLHDRISGNVIHGDKPGPKQLLSPVEEAEFSEFLIEVAQAGYGKTSKEIRQIAGRVAVDKGRKKTPNVSYGWFHRFLQRQPQLSYRKGDPTANVRMNCLSKQVISEYFDLLTEVLTENELLHSPNRIYNVDETGITSDGHAPRVIAKRGQKKVRYRTTGNKNQITVIACVSASGQCIAPFVIFDAKRMNTQVKPPCTYLQDTCKKNKKRARSARIQFCKICRKNSCKKVYHFLQGILHPCKINIFLQY